MLLEFTVRADRQIHGAHPALSHGPYDLVGSNKIGVFIYLVFPELFRKIVSFLGRRLIFVFHRISISNSGEGPNRQWAFFDLQPGKGVSFGRVGFTFCVRSLPLLKQMGQKEGT